VRGGNRFRASVPGLRGPGVKASASGGPRLPLHSKNASVRPWRLLEGPVCVSLPNASESIPARCSGSVALASPQALSPPSPRHCGTVKLEARTHELAEARQQRTATSEVLQVISSSPGDLEPVFQTMLANATRICTARFGSMVLFEGNAYRGVAMDFAPECIPILDGRIVRPLADILSPRASAGGI
jgi:hypothetical protein